MKKYDIAILGSGPGGYVSAVCAAKKGLKVCIIEKEELGGTCLNWGCIPTKSFSAASVLMDKLASAKDWGITLEKLSFDITKTVARKDNIVKSIRLGLKALIDSYKIDIIKGKGIVQDAETLVIEETGEKINFKNLIIATGALMKTLDFPNAIDVKKILSIQQLPKKMLIIGGGVIGCECASIFSGFGSEVTLVERADRLLYFMDSSITKEIERIFKRKKIQVVLSCQSIDEYKAKAGEYDVVLTALGMKADLKVLGLDKLGLKLTEDNFIEIDSTCKTSIPNVYAVGDITKKQMLAHYAYYQAQCAVNNILGEKTELNNSAVPMVVFTNPEIASVGLTQEQAQAKGINILSASFPFMALGRAKTMGESNGFVKIVYDAATTEVLGVHVIGANASEIIATAAVFVTKKMKFADISDIICAHPTMSEGLIEASLLAQGKSFHMPKMIQ